MTDLPWPGDACSLVDAYRSGDRSPVEELEATLVAIESSELNCFSHLDADRARAAARTADVARPFGGVPVGVKELEPVAGWPWTEGSLVFKDRIADHTSHHVARLFDRGGVVPVGLTTASEFGGLNVSVTRLNGVTHNPWRHGCTVGGSSGGSAAAVAGGLCTLATGGDGGGSIRIPAGYTGLVGMKGTFGRLPRSPHAYARPNTVVVGALARSVRDVARHWDVCAGYHPYDPTSLPSAGRWEAELGSSELRGLRVAVVPSFGNVKLEPGIEDRVRAHAKALIDANGMIEVEVALDIPSLGAHWMMGNLATLLADLGERWPRCAGDLTEEIAIGLRISQSMYNLNMAATAELLRIQANETMARAFEQADLLIMATNPGVAFPARAATSTSEKSFVDWAQSSEIAKVGFRAALFATRLASTVAPELPSKLLDVVNERFPDLVAMGALTMISNMYGNPAVSVPAGTVGGLPVGMQVLAAHHRDALLLDVALAVERDQPWPLVAPATARSALRTGD